MRPGQGQTRPSLAIVICHACQWSGRKRNMHTSTLSQRQFPQGAPSTTSQRTLRARHDTQARAARRLVTLCGGASPPSPVIDARFTPIVLSPALVLGDEPLLATSMAPSLAMGCLSPAGDIASFLDMAD